MLKEEREAAHRTRETGGEVTHRDEKEGGKGVEVRDRTS
jgi:hypothetical protein